MVVNSNPATGLNNLAKILISTFLLLWLSVSSVAPVEAKPAFSSIAVDARTGKILFARNADSKRYPASLTKIMTLYLVFEDLKAGRITMNTNLRMSRYAAARPPSKLGIKPGRSIKVRHAIMALVTKSANDVATAIAENLEGSEKRFARRMTRTARRIGMTRTTFRNASGLPNRSQMTTARDMATLGLRMQRDFPRYYKFFKTRRFTYRGRRYGNHNRLLGRIEGVDGIKTGYTRASGFNLTTSARRGKKRIVAVVMGGRTGRSRNRYMSALVKRMFAKKRLTNSSRIASVAGTPPGYKKIRTKSKTRLASIRALPLPRKKPVRTPVRTKVAAVVKKQQDRILVPAKPVTTSVSTFKTAILTDEDVAPFTNDTGSRAINSSGKADLLVAKKTTIKKTTKVVEKALPDTNQHKDTWNIQIGASPSKAGATGLLAKASKKARKNLNGKVAFTMEVRKNGSKFYRARFAGFNRRTATRACRTLSKKGIGCFALAPRS